MRFLVYCFFVFSLLHGQFIFDIDESKHKNIVKKIFFLENETKILTVGDRTLRIWDRESQMLLKTFHLYSPTDFAGIIHDAVLSKDASKLYIGGYFDASKNYQSVGDLYVIDLKKMEIEHILRGHNNSIMSVALTLDGSQLVSIDGNNLLIFRETKTYKITKTVDLSKYKIPNFTLIKLYNASFDKKDNLWLSGVGKAKYSYKGHIFKIDTQTYKINNFLAGIKAENIHSLDDGSMVFLENNLVSGDTWVIQKDFDNNKKIGAYSFNRNIVGSFCINHDESKILITNANDIQKENLIFLKNKKRETFQVAFPSTTCTFSKNGLLAIANANGNIHLFENSKEKILGNTNASQEIFAVGIKDQNIYIGNKEEKLLGEPTMFDEHPFFYKLSSFAELFKNPNDSGIFRAFDLLGDFSIETKSGNAKDTDLLIRHNGSQHLNIKRDQFNGNGHSAATLVPNELYVASGAITGELSLYELRLGKKIHEFLGHSSTVNSLAVSKDGQYLISGSKDRTIKIWSLKHIKQQLRSQKPQKALIEQDLKTYSNNYKKMGYKKTFEDMVRLRKDFGLPLSTRPPSSKPLATLFLSGDEWILWNEHGYYASSPLGDEKIGWVVNSTKKDWATWIGANQFERALYHPNLLRDWIITHGNIDVYKKYNLPAKALKKLLASAPVKVDILSPKTATYIDSSVATLSFSLPKKVEKLTVFVNNIPVIHSKKPFAREYEETIPLFSKFNKVHIETMEKGKMAKSEILIKSTKKAPPKGDLYLLSIGVKEFKYLKNKDLRYTTKDALAIAGIFDAQSESYENIHIKVLADELSTKPTKNNILDALSFIKHSKPTDTVIVFLASHGVSDVNGAYYFVPQDATQQDIESLEKKDAQLNSLVPWSAFFDTLYSSLGKRILIVDTCESKNISGTYELYSLIKRSTSSKFAIVTASKGDEYSQEFDKVEHGLFTFGLLEAFKGKGKSDINNDGSITLQEAFDYSFTFVQQNFNRSYGSQTPQMSGTQSLFDIELVKSSQ